MPNCAGCGRTFSSRGYTNHLLQTTKATCREIRYQYDIALDLASNSDDENENPLTPLSHFQGNFFGNYTAGDFEVDENDQEEHVKTDFDKDDEDNNEDDEDDELEEGGWEPPIAEHFQHNVIIDEDAESADNAGHSYAEQQAINLDVQKKTHIITFPSDRAGAPISKTRESSDYIKYKTSLHDQNNGGNIWTPFNSQLDWEIARWAKIRGPGSTAVSELLGIENVSAMFFKLDEHLTNTDKKFTR